MIGELAGVQAVIGGKKAAFLLPYRALVNEKYEEFTARYGPAGVRVVRCSGDATDGIGPVLTGRYDLAFFTYETFLNLALGSARFLAQLGVGIGTEAASVSEFPVASSSSWNVPWVTLISMSSGPPSPGSTASSPWLRLRVASLCLGSRCRTMARLGGPIRGPYLGRVAFLCVGAPSRLFHARLTSESKRDSGKGRFPANNRTRGVLPRQFTPQTSPLNYNERPQRLTLSPTA
jgi:hypothetical protein